MSTKKVIGGSVAAIVILIIAQLAAQLAASALNLIKIPDGICNIIAGIFYVGLTYVILKIYIEKVIRLPISDFGMPVFHIKRIWILIAILLPLLVKGSYLLFFQGAYVSSHMNGKQIFRTLSAGIMFTGIAAGFVEEMVFRGVILNLLRKNGIVRWRLSFHRCCLAWFIFWKWIFPSEAVCRFLLQARWRELCFQ